MLPLCHENACSEDKNEGVRTERTKSLISLMTMLGSEIRQKSHGRVLAASTDSLFDACHCLRWFTGYLGPV